MRRISIAVVSAVLSLGGCALAPATPLSHPVDLTPHQYGVRATPLPHAAHHQPGPRMLPDRPEAVPAVLSSIVTELLAVLGERGRLCAPNPTPWLFPGADAGVVIQCDVGTLRLFHYPDRGGQEWLAAQQDFSPGNRHGYAAGGLVLVNQLAKHDADSALYAVIDKG